MSESLAHHEGDYGHGPAGLPHQLIDAQKIAGVVGVVCLGILAIGLLHPYEAFRSLLFGFHFWLDISLGCLGFVMISHLTGGAWGVVIRRFGEAGFMNLPVMAVFFLIMALGYKHLFPWAHMDDFNPANHKTHVEEYKTAYGVLVHRQSLYNPLVFTLRTLIYFLIWCFLAFSLRAGSIRLDRGPDLVLRRKMRKTSAAGMVLFFVTTTGYAMDYILSRETNWYSSIIGFITAVGIGMSGMAFMSLMVCWFSDKKPIKDVLIPQHTNDLGNILLALVILWMYTSFAQFLIQWNGNMPEDTGYYIQRGIGVVRNGWQWVALLLLLGQFFLPFFLLLMKGLKRNPVTFIRICWLLLFMRMVHALWVMAPSGWHEPEKPGRIFWTDPFAFLGVGGIWFFFFVRTLATQPLLPRNVADQPEVLSYGTAAHAH